MDASMFGKSVRELKKERQNGNGWQKISIGSLQIYS